MLAARRMYDSGWLRPLRWPLQWKEIIVWNYQYACTREPKVKVRPPRNPAADAEIITQLKADGLHVVDFDIDIPDYERYVQVAGYREFPHYYGGGTERNFAEKSLEHYLAARLLALTSDDVYIDIATGSSPAPDIYRKLYGCTVFRQDLAFPEGIVTDRIGGDAARMPVADGFANKMALHCSFEHFEGDADVRFMQEANRVLTPGGRLCIVPLYLTTRYAVLTDPRVWPRDGMSFEPDAEVQFLQGYRCRHGRLYDVGHFMSRIRDHVGQLRLTLYVVRNERQIDPACYVKFVALLTKPAPTSLPSGLSRTGWG